MGLFNKEKKNSASRDFAKENEELRKQLSSVNKSSKKQLQLEEKQLRLLNRQLRDTKKEESKRNREEAIEKFRQGVKKLASKPLSQSEANRRLFGTTPLRNANKAKGTYWHV